MAVVKLDKNNIEEQIKKDVGNLTPKTQQVTTAKTRDGKKNLIYEILEPILNRSISDIVVTIMATISDIVIGAVDVRLYGENRHKNTQSIIGRNYNSLYRPKTVINQGSISQNLSSLYQNPTKGFRLQDVVVPTRGDAELVIDALSEKIDIYGVATVGDYYDAVGIQTSSIDFKYGWVNLSSADKHRTFDGYAIILPTPKPLD